ncbi:MAG: stage II sporulation protein R [Candidatus Scatovivens sp.]
MKIFKRFILILFLLLIFLLFSIFSYASNVSKNLECNIFRLHIIANSDSDADQSLKLQVRDNIISYLEKTCDNCKSKNDFIEIANNNLEDLKLIAENTIKDKGLNYPVTIEIGNFYFPTKHYGNISFPAGYYDGLKIKIGNADGQNWWCSLFPPLCFTDVSSGIIDEESEENLKSNISEEEFSVVSSTNGVYKLKFKLIEFLNEKNIL